jgi:EAL domain-containing protein (putative c-di-GMP-specific phosphodiesterase class I)
MPWREALRSLMRGARASEAARPGHGAAPAVPEPDFPAVPDPAPPTEIAARVELGAGISRADIEAVLRCSDPITMDFQPILDVRSSRTAGWEVLARFDGRCTPGPDQWFAAAYRYGLGQPLELVTLRRALTTLRMRTPGTFMSLNVSPAALDDPQVLDVIAGSAPLTGLVIELTEHTSPPRPGPWLDSCRRLRELGATIAIDDIGKGYAEMLQILQLQPQIIKIDKVLVDDVADFPAHRAMLRFLGLFADEVDAWLLAEGVETMPQLRVLQALGIPLAQGYLVGAPASVPRPCRQEVTAVRVEPPAPRASTEVERRRVVADVMRSADGRDLPWSASALRVPVGLSLVEAARRAITRPTDRRYEPLQCIAVDGSVVGELAVHDLVLSLVEQVEDRA